MTITYPDGIYYDMPEDVYHALPRLSASGIKNLLISGMDFWSRSWMNPSRREYERDHLDVGKAYHKRMLEGLPAFQSCYAVEPDCDRRTKEGKQKYADWVANNPKANAISQELYDEILEAGSYLERHPDNPFVGGRPEVSVLWTDEETGVPMKARLDYLSDALISDLKTFSNSSGSNIARAVGNNIAKYRYVMQAVIYLDAHRQAFKKEADFLFVFQQVGQARIILGKALKHDSIAYQQGWQQYRRGVELFRDYYNRFGAAPWMDDFRIDALEDVDLPMWMFDE